MCGVQKGRGSLTSLNMIWGLCSQRGARAAPWTAASVPWSLAGPSCLHPASRRPAGSFHKPVLLCFASTDSYSAARWAQGTSLSP